MPFPPAFIDEVIARNPIEDVVGQYVTLKRSGSNLFGLCPFHNEKSPSFSVSPGKQMYYCFGCGAGGNVLTFMMQYENFTFQEAMQKHPERVIEHAVKGMLPKNTLGRAMGMKLKVYAGAEHPHAAQQPREIKMEDN